ncbi:MAG TPA: hypothetical protein VFK02_15115 [Kofleriaceae bacterium]|nr:hypothetical protein [Kofleriaceae bacterium]
MITLVLAVVMMTAAVTQVCASPVVASAVDDAPDVEPALPASSQPVVLPEPDCREQVIPCVPDAPPAGRLHAVLVFRPPR